MSCEQSDVKRRCVENDDSMSNPSTSIAPTRSQSNNGTSIKSFRDLIFTVSGTMPAVENSEMEQNTGPFSGKRKLDRDLDNSAADSSSSNATDRKEAAIVNESDVGITEFISEHEGFSGILKQR